MPSWRVHLFTGILLAIFLIYICYIFNVWYPFVVNNQVQFFYLLHICFILILGSVLPDFDYRKTRIRHALGPVLGLFIIVSYIYLNLSKPFEIDLKLILILLLAFLIFPFLAGLIFPFKHHGKLHSLSAAIIYGLCWLCVELFIFNFSIPQAGIVAVFGFVGYFFHLLLDKDLKLI